MIIEITIAPDYILNANDVSILEKISIAHQEASHLFICNPYNFTRIHEQTHDNRLIKSSLINILKQSRQSLSIIKSVNLITKIIFSENKVNERNKANKQTIFTYSQHYISGTKELLPAIILAENRTDADFYRELARVYSEFEFGSQSIFINTEQVGGGGDTTSDELINLHNSYMFRPFFCIIDSDKAHPKQGHFGKTAKGIISTAEANPQLKFNYSILEMMELENILPVSMIADINDNENRQQSESYKSSIANLYEMEKSKPEFFFHSDLKEGINLKKAIALDGSHGRFWLNKKWPTINDECFEKKRCSCNPCCHIIRKGPSKLLEKGLALVQKKSASDLKENMPVHLWSFWYKYGCMVFSWGCARPSMRHII